MKKKIFFKYPEELQEQGSNAFLEESGRISIHQIKQGHVFQLLHLYGDWTSGKIRCLEKKNKNQPLPWRCFCGDSCQHAIQKEKVASSGKVQGPLPKLRECREEPWTSEASLWRQPAQHTWLCSWHEGKIANQILFHIL